MYSDISHLAFAITAIIMSDAIVNISCLLPLVDFYEAFVQVPSATDTLTFL
jgi:hypothetical protein